MFHFHFRDKMFGMMTLCMVAMLALFYLGMIARDARGTCRERKSKKRLVQGCQI